MKEQEWYKNLLAKVITETENKKINSSEEMVKTLIDEIRVSKKDHGVTIKAETVSE